MYICAYIHTYVRMYVVYMYICDGCNPLVSEHLQTEHFILLMLMFRTLYIVNV